MHAEKPINETLSVMLEKDKVQDICQNLMTTGALL